MQEIMKDLQYHRQAVQALEQELTSMVLERVQGRSDVGGNVDVKKELVNEESGDEAERLTLEEELKIFEQELIHEEKGLELWSDDSVHA
jgi:hypothetical protein